MTIISSFINWREYLSNKFVRRRLRATSRRDQNFEKRFLENAFKYQDIFEYLITFQSNHKIYYAIRCALILILNRKKEKKSKFSAKKYKWSLLIINFINENDSLCIVLNAESKKKKKIKSFSEKIWRIVSDN